MHEVMKSKVYRKLDLLMKPRQDNFILDKCTHSCSNFIAENVIKAANSGTIISNIVPSDSNE